MTKEEALKIPNLNIEVDELTEDIFYWGMAQEGRISAENAEKSVNRIKSYAEEIPLEVLKKAQKMMENIDKYGVACAEWCN